MSLDVTTPQNFWAKNHLCYLVLELGKLPKVAMEIVSNKVGGELEHFSNIWLGWCDENNNLLLVRDESAQKTEKELLELKEKLR